jgi:hypothetical protein
MEYWCGFEIATRWLESNIFLTLLPVRVLDLIPKTGRIGKTSAVRHSGCRIPVVRLLWEQLDGVQFPAPRPIATFCLKGLREKNLQIFNKYAILANTAGLV